MWCKTSGYCYDGWSNAGEVAGYAESSFIAPLMYFIGIVAVLVAAIILKKTKPFSGKPAPFVMELPQYHIPQAKTVLLHVWERLKGFIIKAGTILFLACVVMWFLGGFGFTADGFGIVEDSADSLMAVIGGSDRSYSSHHLDSVSGSRLQLLSQDLQQKKRSFLQWEFLQM